ncbi:hypothetical protein SPFM8_00110 [Salmonella phage SPFM8]|nr:hypothetical protein SPFM8_00110 [Salmonella phage SPFM8]
MKFKSGVNLNCKQTVNYSFNVDNPPSEFAPGEFSVVRREGNGVYDITVKTRSNYSYTLTTGLTDTELAGEVLQLKQRAIYLTLTTAIGSGSPGELIDWMLCYANGGASILRAYSLAVKYRLPSIPPETTLNYTYNASRRRYSLSYQNTTFDRAGVTLITSEQYATYDGTGGLGEAISRVDPIARNTLDLQYWENWRGESELMEAIVAVGANCQWDNVIGDLYFPPVDIKFEATAEMIAAEREANKDRYPVDTNPKYQSGFTLDYHAIGIGDHAYVTGMARTGHVCHGGVWISLVVKSGGKKLTLGDDYVITTPIGTKYRMLFPAHAPFYTTAVVPDPHYQEPGNMQTGEAVL